MVTAILHWFSGDTKREQKAAEKRSKQRLEEIDRKHAEACERHTQVYADASKSAKELQEITTEARQCFAEHVDRRTAKPVAETGGDNLP